MTTSATIRINVDPTNPGQFFACCGLLELADRRWIGAEGWFEEGAFCIACDGDLTQLVVAISSVEISKLHQDDTTATGLEIGEPFRPLRLDWWRDEVAGGKQLKVWAGTMESYGIARAMQNAFRSEGFVTEDMLNFGMVVSDAGDTEKKKEPFYFDARRCQNAHSRDVGFSTNDLQMSTTAVPAVELLCLVGLQRCLPSPTGRPRLFQYHTWFQPIPPPLLPIAVIGALPLGGQGYVFENAFRTGQRKHKAFRSAVPLT
jgi:CRISPR-associated protein Csb3